MNKSFVVIEADLETKSFDKQLEEIEYRLKELDFELSHAKELKLDKRTIKEYEKEVEKLNNQYVNLKHQQDKLNQHDFSQIGKGIENITKKVGKWALAVFGVRSAYMFVRNAINTISQDNEQLATDIDYMKRALAYTIEPVVQTIVNLAKTLMQYVQYIVKAWTGRDIFASANKSLKNANKSAKELQKTSASFDKFNKLNANKSTSGGGSASLKPLEQADVPKWLQWIAENKDIVISGLSGIAVGLIAVKLGLTGIQGLGIGITLFGIIQSIKSIISYIKNPSWENFGKIITGIGVALLGLALIFGSIPLAIGGAIAVVTGILAGFWDKIEEFLNNLQNNIYSVGDNIMNWFNSKMGLLGMLFNTIIGTIIGIITGGIDTIKSSIGGILKFLKSVLDSIILLFKGDFKGALKTILKGIGNLFIDVINTLIGTLNTIISPVRGLIVAFGKITGKKWTMDNIKISKIPRLAKGGIVNMPGKGINYGGANIGERSREGVLPLSDTAVMQTLGKEIGKNVVVNADITLELESRILARVMKEIQSNNTFARNGG